MEVQHCFVGKQKFADVIGLFHSPRSKTRDLELKNARIPYKQHITLKSNKIGQAYTSYKTLTTTKDCTN